MAYKKAGQLLNLAIDIASRRYGMTYSEIDDYSKTGNIEARLRDLYNKLKAIAGQNLKNSTLIDYDYLIESNYIAATTILLQLLVLMLKLIAKLFKIFMRL